MKFLKENKSVAIVVICLLIILVTGLVSLAVKTNNGRIVVKEVKISPYGTDLAGSMFIPKSALKTDQAGNFINKVPAVIVNAGFTNSRTYLDNVAIQLARCGFAVFQIDMYGHGHSEGTSNRGYPNPPSPFTDDISLLGAQDALAYLRTLGFVDQTRMGMCGHSLGGSASGRLAEKSAGFFTLQDKLLNMLHSEFGVTITAEQVAAQDADAVALAALSEDKLPLYEMGKAQIVAEDRIAVRNYLIFDADAAGCAPHVVEVAGIPVWRALQANLGLVMNMSGHGGKGMQDKDAALSSEATLTMLALKGAAERDTWYQTNLSSTQERAISTKLNPFYGDASDRAVQAAAANNRLRMITTPWGWHGFTALSTATAKAAMQFFSTGMSYYNGEIVAGDSSNTIKNPVASHWLVKEIFSAIGFFALLALILPLIDILMKLPFFASMHGEPQMPLQSKKSPMFWISMIVFVALPVLTYSKGGGWGANIKPSPFSTVELTTRIAYWAIIMTAILFALVIIKYFAYDKKKTGVSFCDMYGLRYSGKNIAKSIVLALVVFGFVSVLLTIYYNLFAASNLKFTPAGSIIFTALCKEQYYSWLLYSVYFLPFYLLNSMMINSARLKEMDEKTNMWLMAFLNSIGMFILGFLQFFVGYVRTSKTLFAIPPGSSATVYMTSFFFVMLFVSTIYNRKLYLKTGSAIPGALVNLLLYMIPGIQLYMYYSFL
ncbi:MAG TPA: alpha/beta hydrolase [Firmicutes bacterium]|nr:alpha/beta hydrolase [Bacillota bacterium]